MNIFKLFKKTKLKTQLITIFLLITLIPIIVLSFLSYYYTESIFFDRTLTNLNDIVDREEAEIILFFNQKKENANKIADYLTSNFKDLKIANKDEAEISFLANALGFSNYFIFEDNIPVLAISSLDKINFDKELYFSLDDKNNLLKSYLTVPLIQNGQKMGNLTLEIKPEEFKKWLTSINRFASLGKSFEFIFGVLQQGKLYLLVPPRNGYDPNDKFPELEKAIHNGTISGTSNDFRGKKVIVVSKNLPSLNGGIVGKIDYNEALKPLYMMKFMFISAAIAVAGLVILIAPQIAAYIVNPIKSLINKTKKMAAGNLSQRIDISSQNELGLLGQSFNEMTEKLQNLINNLDKNVEIRTEELTRTIEDLKNTQERLIAQEKLASLGSMTAGVAHEIKNPLNFVNNFSYLSLDLLPVIENYIQKKKSDSDDSKEVIDSLETMKNNLQQINEQGKRADNIIKRMLAHSRTQAGAFSETDINSLLKETINLAFHTLRVQHPESHIKIEFELDPDLKKIQAVSEDINRVILNLIQNAFYSVIAKNKQDPSFNPLITVSTRADINYIEIRIHDNGLGIPENKMANIFTPFFTTKPTGEGTGLGLSLSFNIIAQEHGGTLEFKSKEGEFAEFIIKLPIKENAYAS